MLESTAGRGRELLSLFNEEKPDGNTTELCQALLAGSGEASGIALASEILRRYREMTPEQRAQFFDGLYTEFSADEQAIKQAADAYFESHATQDLLRLTEAVEAPRQELLRRLNTAPRSTAQLVAMRADLLRLLKQQSHLALVDADFKHLLSSWFNRGFLQLQRIDWNTPAHILEKLINYESVHEIQGWDDLRRRLADDRRCYAFFHPAIADEPLIFVEVALVQDIPAHVQPLLDCQAEVLSIGEADTAVFYSINNTLNGLRGVSFGNFLIKQVMEDLQHECPWLKNFVTLSPMPGFAATLGKAIEGEIAGLSPRALDQMLEGFAADLHQLGGLSSPCEDLLALLKEPKEEQRPLLAKALQPVALAYLTLPQGKRRVSDPVAAFHLANGARLERINAFADDSAERRKSSFGCMVNYRYEAEEVEINHEAFVAEGKIALAKPLAKLDHKLQALRTSNTKT